MATHTAGSTTNPNTQALLNSLDGVFAATASPAYTGQLITLAVINAVSFGCIAAVLVLRIRHGGIKSMTLFSVIKGGYVRPNMTVLYSVFSLVFIVAVELFISHSIAWALSSQNLYDIMIYRCCIWLPLYAGGIIHIWSTTLFSLTLTHPRTQVSKSNRTPPARIVNSFFILYPIFSLATIVTPAIIANSRFNTLFSIYSNIIAPLLSSHSVPKPEQTAELFQAQHSFALKTPPMLDALRWVWINWAVSLGILNIVFILVSLNQFEILRRSIRSLKASGVTTADQTRSLQRTFHSVLLTTGLILVMMLSSFIEAVVCATHTTELVSGTKLGLDVILTILWILTLSSAIVNTVILQRSNRKSPHHQLPSKSSQARATTSLSLENQRKSTTSPFPNRPPSPISVIPRIPPPLSTPNSAFLLPVSRQTNLNRNRSMDSAKFSSGSSFDDRETSRTGEEEDEEEGGYYILREREGYAGGIQTPVHYVTPGV